MDLMKRLTSPMDFDVTRADVLLSCSSSRQPSRKADYLGHLGAASRDPLCSSQAGQASAIPTWLSNGLLGTTTSDVPSTGALPPVSELRPGIRSGSGLQLWALSAQTAYQQTSSLKDDMRGFARQEAIPYQVDGATSRALCAHETYPTESMFAFSEISRSDLATVEALSSLRTSVEQIAATEGGLNVGGIATSYQNALDHPYSNISLLSISNAQLTSEEQTTLNRIVDDSLFSVTPKPSLPHTIQPSTVVPEKAEKNSGTLETATHHSSLVALTCQVVGPPSIEAACKSEPPLREDRNPPACPNVAPVQCAAGQNASQAERRAASLVEEVRCFRCTVCLSLHKTKAEAIEHVALLHSPGAQRRPSGHAVIGRAEKRFLCGKCRRGFVTLDECCRHLNQAHKAKSKKIRLEWIYTNQPDQIRAATPAEEVLAEVPTVLQGSGTPEYGLQKEALRATPKKDSGRKFVDAPMSSSQKAWRRKVNREQESFICERKGCNVRFRELENLEYHVRCHRADAADFACPECSLVCLRWRTMTVHLWRQHLCDMELHCCDQCNFRTYSLSKLENFHKRIHGDERPFLCDVCGKGFKTSKQLRNHKAIHAQAKRCAAGGSVRGESCAECGRCFCKRRLLQLHRDSVHRKLRPFLCSYCGHRASDQSSLKMHLRQHTGEKPFACHLCDYQTGDHNSLRRHKMRHTGAKPYKCPHCPYACIQSSTFKGHLYRKHPGESGTVLFACEQCPFRTVRKDNYKAHLAGHSEQAAAARDGSERGMLEHAPRLSLGQIVELSAGAS